MEMIPEFEKLISVRVPAKLKVKIDQLVASGRFKSASHLVRTALERFLAEV